MQIPFSKCVFVIKLFFVSRLSKFLLHILRQIKDGMLTSNRSALPLIIYNNLGKCSVRCEFDPISRNSDFKGTYVGLKV